MTHAQKILCAGHHILRCLAAAQVVVPLDVRLEFHRRIDLWCALAQTQEVSHVDRS